MRPTLTVKTRKGTVSMDRDRAFDVLVEHTQSLSRTPPPKAADTEIAELRGMVKELADEVKRLNKELLRLQLGASVAIEGKKE